MKKLDKNQEKQIIDSLISLITLLQIPLIAVLLFYVVYSDIVFLS
mgnify:CR=1 FL=1